METFNSLLTSESQYHWTFHNEIAWNQFFGDAIVNATIKKKKKKIFKVPVFKSMEALEKVHSTYFPYLLWVFSTWKNCFAQAHCNTNE